jgi:hypothetical protein
MRLQVVWCPALMPPNSRALRFHADVRPHNVGASVACMRCICLPAATHLVVVDTTYAGSTESLFMRELKRRGMSASATDSGDDDRASSSDGARSHCREGIWPYGMHMHHQLSNMLYIMRTQQERTLPDAQVHPALDASGRHPASRRSGRLRAHLRHRSSTGRDS